MGERLNIEIINKGKTLANCYYHWSGYSNSAVELAQAIIHNIGKIKYDSDVATAIKLLESTGAGLTDREIDYAKTIDELKDINFKPTEGRNEGLIAISENEMNQTRMWQEHALYIYLDEQRMNFKVFSDYSRWDWESDHKDDNQDDKPKFDELEKVDVNFDDIKFSDIDSFVEFINNHLEDDFTTVLDSSTVYSSIY